MKKIIFLFTILYVSITAVCQTSNDSIFYKVVEIKPEYPGGSHELRMFIANNLKYPEYARDKKIEGKVVVEFIIDKEGLVRDIKVFKGIHPSIDSAAIKVVEKMQQWTPGKKNKDGPNVNVYMQLPLFFIITNKGRRDSEKGINNFQ